MPPAEPAARTRTEVAIAKRLPAPAPKPVLRNATLVHLSIDVRNRMIQQRYELTSDDGSNTSHRHVIIRDGQSSISTADGEQVVDTEEGFEGAAASLVAFLQAQMAYAESRGLV